jgi:hypothetical protein
MKKVLFLFCLFSVVCSSQTSSFNKGLKKESFSIDEWYLNEGVETHFNKQNPVGYKKSYDELKKILTFFNLDLLDPEIDNSLIHDSIEDLKDFQNLSNSLKIEWSTIDKVWRATDDFQINWMCNDKLNLILIRKIKQ